MISKLEFFELLVPRVEPILSAQGFKYLKSKDAFVKKIAGGWVKLSCSYYHVIFDNVADFGFSVRFDEVEKLYYTYRYINPSNTKDTSTVLFTVAELVNHSDSVFRCSNYSELNDVVENIYVPFLERKLPHLVEKYSNLDNTFDLFYNMDEEHHHLLPKVYRNLITPIFIAYVLRLENLNVIIEQCKRNFEELRKKWPFSYDIKLYDQNIDKITTDLLGYPSQRID